MLKVLKFGGSSLSDSGQFAKVKEIVNADSARRAVVVSAPGRRSKEDSKITDLLYLCHAHLKYDVPFDHVKRMIRDRYVEIKDSCGLTVDIGAEVDKVFEGVTKKTSADYLASRGEYLNAILMAEYLGYKFVDAADWLKFDYNGKVNYEASGEALRELFGIYEKIVVPGFYGSLPDGSIKVFSRGGSDITGAIVASLLNADIYENWTDVPGILMTDPRIVKNPKTIIRITYDELRELSYMGASVLHEDTVFPVRIKDIPVNIRNTNDPENPGTIIQESYEEALEIEKERFITGIAGKKNFSIVSIKKDKLGEGKLGLLRKALEIYDRFGIPIEQIPSGVDSFCIVAPSDAMQKRKYDLVNTLNEELELDGCELIEGVSLIAIVGRQMAYRTGIAGKIFKALGENKINLRTIQQGADEINIMIGVLTEDFEKTIEVLYNSFAK